MDRSKYPASVVPYPIDKATKAKGPVAMDENSEWDAKWLRPSVTTVPMAVERRTPVAAQRAVIEEPIEENEKANAPLYLRVLRWLFPEVNQRRATRYPTPNLVAYYWTGGAPYSYQVGDMSATGLYLLTKDRWAPGTLIQITLQAQTGRFSADNSICVLSEVVRWGENGSGFNFILKDYENVLDYGMTPNEAIDRKSIEKFLHKVGVPVR